MVHLLLLLLLRWHDDRLRVNSVRRHQCSAGTSPLCLCDAVAAGAVVRVGGGGRGGVGGPAAVRGIRGGGGETSGGGAVVTVVVAVVMLQKER